MTYQFDNIQLINPIINVGPVVDHMDGNCTVHAVFSDSNYNISLQLGVMPYVDDIWTTAMVEEWVDAALAANRVED